MLRSKGIGLLPKLYHQLRPIHAEFSSSYVQLCHDVHCNFPRRAYCLHFPNFSDNTCWPPLVQDSVSFLLSSCSSVIRTHKPPYWTVSSCSVTDTELRTFAYIVKCIPNIIVSLFFVDPGVSSSDHAFGGRDSGS